MGLIATDRVRTPVFCFGVQGFHSNDFSAFSFHYIDNQTINMHMQQDDCWWADFTDLLKASH